MQLFTPVHGRPEAVAALLSAVASSTASVADLTAMLPDSSGVPPDVYAELCSAMLSPTEHDKFLGTACAALARSLQLLTADSRGSQLLQVASCKAVGFMQFLSLYVVDVLKGANGDGSIAKWIKTISMSGLFSTFPAACCAVAAALAQKPPSCSGLVHKQQLMALTIVAASLLDVLRFLCNHLNTSGDEGDPGSQANQLMPLLLPAVRLALTIADRWQHLKQQQHFEEPPWKALYAAVHVAHQVTAYCSVTVEAARMPFTQEQQLCLLQSPEVLLLVVLRLVHLASVLQQVGGCRSAALKTAVWKTANSGSSSSSRKHATTGSCQSQQQWQQSDVVPAHHLLLLQLTDWELADITDRSLAGAESEACTALAAVSQLFCHICDWTSTSQHSSIDVRSSADQAAWAGSSDKNRSHQHCSRIHQLWRPLLLTIGEVVALLPELRVVSSGVTAAARVLEGRTELCKLLQGLSTAQQMTPTATRQFKRSRQQQQAAQQQQQQQQEFHADAFEQASSDAVELFHPLVVQLLAPAMLHASTGNPDDVQAQADLFFGCVVQLTCGAGCSFPQQRAAHHIWRQNLLGSSITIEAAVRRMAAAASRAEVFGLAPDDVPQRADRLSSLALVDVWSEPGASTELAATLGQSRSKQFNQQFLSLMTTCLKARQLHLTMQNDGNTQRRVWLQALNFSSSAAGLVRSVVVRHLGDQCALNISSNSSRGSSSSSSMLACGWLMLLGKVLVTAAQALLASPAACQHHHTQTIQEQQCSLIDQQKLPAQTPAAEAQQERHLPGQQQQGGLQQEQHIVAGESSKAAEGCAEPLQAEDAADDENAIHTALDVLFKDGVMPLESVLQQQHVRQRLLAYVPDKLWHQLQQHYAAVVNDESMRRQQQQQGCEADSPMQEHCAYMAEQTATQLVALGESLCCLVPVKWCCNNPSCSNLSQLSEQQLVCGTRTGNSSVCSGCKTARYCSEACQKAHWRSHKAVCKAIRAASNTSATQGHCQPLS